MRADRLIAMLHLLQDRTAVTAPQLATELEVSTRTIYRDVEALQHSGVPLWTEQGTGGGIRLLPGWRTRLDGLSSQEAGALFLAGAPRAVVELGLGPVLVSAQAKVLANLPPELRHRAERVRQRFHLDAPGWFHRDEEVPALATIAEAVWGGRRLDIRYQRSDRIVRRRLDPLGLVLKGGTWYVVAGHAGDLRTYRAGRVRAATIRSERARRPDDFDLATWWDSRSDEFEASLLRYRCRLRLSPAALRQLPHVTDRRAALRAADTVGPADRDGWRIVELEGETEEVLASQLLGLAGGIAVVEPVPLRRRLADAGAALAAANGPDPGQAGSA